ncbi:hypothetical protein WA158_003684 [Blastocystis sp. Blastoise]
MQYYLDELKLDISNMHFVHIAGSKGKGTTSAYTESILRAHGLKTGLYTSPHLQNICERFRINGKMISEELFVEHFYPIWNKMMEIRKNPNKPEWVPNWPGFFRFLTIMCFSIFKSQDIDVVILEVGLGGRLDATNIINTPIVTGITLLDLEHTNILGNTIQEIAYEKAGIFKPHVPAYSVIQEPNAVTVLNDCAKTINCSLSFISTSELPFYNEARQHLNIPSYLFENMSLAYSLSKETLNYFNISIDNNICYKTIQTVPLAARGQTIEDPANNRRFYIDGAHTIKSMLKTAEWFNQCFQKHKDIPSIKVLIFYCGRDKDIFHLLSPLVNLSFDIIIFTSVTFAKVEYSPVHLLSIDEQLKAHNLVQPIESPSVVIMKNGSANEINNSTDIINEYTHQLYLFKLFTSMQTKNTQKYILSKTVQDVLPYLNTYTSSIPSINHDIPVEIYVTGSLYLAGDVLDSIHFKQI